MIAVVLVGVGADTDHVRPALRLTNDGDFDYIPIPESYPTAESKTYGNWELEHSDGFASDHVTAISPRGNDSDWINDEAAIESHPVHHDPNFEAMTFGDRRGGGGTGSTLVKHFGASDEADMLGFYTGVKESENDPNLNRFLYGYMTVDQVHDLSDLESAEYDDALKAFPENAHAKRLAVAGSAKHDDIVIVEGKQPTRKLRSPLQVSERIDEPPWYRVSDRFATEFRVEGGQKGIGRKFPLVLDVDASEFVEKVDRATTERS